MMNNASHWDEVYTQKENITLGWYETSPEPSLSLVQRYVKEKEGLQFHAGTGRSTLIKHLLADGYERLVLNDISEVALVKLRDDLQGEDLEDIQLLLHDLREPLPEGFSGQFSLWHDRAAFHFLTRAEEQQAYFDNIRRAMAVGGIVILAAFAPDGAEKCSGLSVKQWNSTQLKAALGSNFALVHEEQVDYTNPGGALRPFTYAVFRREA